jgi:hypothetical protein
MTTPKQVYGGVDLVQRSYYESWITVYTDSSLEYRGENDGPRVLRHGVEAVNTPITLAEVGRQYGQTSFRKVRDILARLEATVAAETYERRHEMD